MPEDERYHETYDEVPLHRSASATIIQGVAATGALAYGLGHLAEGVAKVKDSFGGKEPDPQQAPQHQPADE